MMNKRFFFGFILLIVLLNTLNAQQNNVLSVKYVKKEQAVTPGQVITFPFLIHNNSSENKALNCTFSAPPGWKVITKSQRITINPGDEKLVLFPVQSGLSSPVGEYKLQMFAFQTDNNDTLSVTDVDLKVKEIEKISMVFVKSLQNVSAGENFTATYLLRNLGNTKKKVFIETQNCDIEGPSEIELAAGETAEFSVKKQTSEDIGETLKEYFTVRAILSGEVKESSYRFFTVFPTKMEKKDLFFRFPISATATYVASNLQNKLERGTQFQISGEGSLDTQGKHQLQFLARGPDLSNLNYLGLYDQYFISYANKNFEVFVGDKAYSFTPLTESSRYGLGTENKIIFNNGLYFGFAYIKPNFYEGFQNEMAGYTGLKINRDNDINFYYIQKNSKFDEDVKLASISANLMPFNKTNLELELSRGAFNQVKDNAFRTSLNTQIWIFYIAGIYFYAGKDYPGYYTNSTFYSGNISARITEKLNLGVFAKEDFSNAELDTFFVTAPYTKSFQSSINYNVAERAYLKFYWRNFERKDRLDLNKFHYKTNSLNAQFSQRIKKFDYNVLGEFGETTNLLLTENNQQTTFRGTADIAYRFNSRNLVRFTGSWSNINSFISGDSRNVIAGIFINSQITRNLKANLHIQNAYDIDDYYRNRNLMQFNLEYKFLKHHVITARSFYTLFKQSVADPEFTATLSYTYNFGVPLKQLIKAGNIKGQVTYDNDKPAEGIVLNLQGKVTITNKDGEFFFNTIHPGKYLMTIDRTKFEINEITNISTPLEINVFEDQETIVNFKITTGARLAGKISKVDTGSGILNNAGSSMGNIIVELKNDFDQFRITTDADGNFSFPLVRPGKYTFKIYENSIPEGYELGTTEYQYYLVPGEEKNIEIELKSKKRSIIFKSANVLTPLKNEGQTKQIITTSPEKKKNKVDSIYYSVQVGAFRKQQTNNSRFFEKHRFDFEKQDGKLHKYFIGRFKTLEEAKQERKKLEQIFRNPYIVKFENDVIQK